MSVRIDYNWTGWRGSARLKDLVMGVSETVLEAFTEPSSSKKLGRAIGGIV